MKKTLLTFLFIGLIPFFGISQCVPNTDFTGILGLEDTAYELTDSTTALPHAIAGDMYETFFNMRIPADTVIEYDLGNGPQLFDPVYLNSISINSVSGLPSGFGWECASQDADGLISDYNCSFPGGGYGCLRLFSGTNEILADEDDDNDGIIDAEDDFPFDSDNDGVDDCIGTVDDCDDDGMLNDNNIPAVYSEVPTDLVGTYPLVVSLDIAAEYAVFGIMVPVEVTDDSMLNYLVLIVEEGNNSGIGEIIDSREFKGLGTYPNPFGESTTIHFGNNNANDVKFSVFDILGNLVYTDNVKTEIGHNEYVFDKGKLTTGLYTYTLSNGLETISERVIIY